jgi:hypothetical protein
MASEHSECEKSGEQYGIRKGPLKGHIRDLIEEVLEYESKRSLMFNEKVHLLKEEDDDIDEDQAAQTQAKDF